MKKGLVELISLSPEPERGPEAMKLFFTELLISL